MVYLESFPAEDPPFPRQFHLLGPQQALDSLSLPGPHLVHEKHSCISHFLLGVKASCGEVALTTAAFGQFCPQ